MPLELVVVPCLSDNYSYIAHDRASGETVVVDPSEAAPIVEELLTRGWRLSHVLLTHHHDDHVAGLSELIRDQDVEVIGASQDAHRLPDLSREVNEGDRLRIAGEDCYIIDVSGHTIGHIAFHFPARNLVFTGDSLMTLGCGRLFEGDANRMFQSMEKIADLPPETLLCSGHEYAAANAAFARTVEPENTSLQRRAVEISESVAKGRPTVPSLLSLELETNPFLRCHLSTVKNNVGLEGASTIEVFTKLRCLKDNF